MGVAGVGGARQSGGAHVLVSTDAKEVLFFTYDSGAGAYWGAWGWYEVWEAFGIPAYRGEKMRSVGDMGCISFSNKQEGLCGHQMRARSKKRTGARRRTRRGGCPLGLRGYFRCPHSGQGEGTWCVQTPTHVPIPTHVHTRSSTSLCRGGWKRSVTTSLLSTSVCSLSDDVHWTLKGVRSALRARITVRWRCQLCGQNEPQRAGPQAPHTLMWLKHFLWTELDSSAVPFSMEQAQCSPISKSLLLSQPLAPYCLF